MKNSVTQRRDEETYPDEVVSKQVTKNVILHSRLEWKIFQFGKVMKLLGMDDGITSEQVEDPQEPFVKWLLHLVPNQDECKIAWFFRYLGSELDEESMVMNIRIHAVKENPIVAVDWEHTDVFRVGETSYLFEVTQEEVMRALKKDGSLQIICDVEYLLPGCITRNEKPLGRIRLDNLDKGLIRIFDSLKEILASALFTDCVIKVGDKVLEAHRCILGQNSEVFRSMFAAEEMLDSQKGIVEIKDAKFEAVQAMVDYIYTGSVDLLEDYAEDILILADKYAILPLKELCERHIATTLNCNNVLSVAIFAETHSASILKVACAKFIGMHRNKILNSPEWAMLKNNGTNLSSDILEMIVTGRVTAMSFKDLMPPDSESESEESVVSFSSIGSDIGMLFR